MSNVDEEREEKWAKKMMDAEKLKIVTVLFPLL